MNVRPATIEDVPAMRGLAEAAPEAAQWSAAEWERLHDPESAQRLALVAEHEGDVIGFVVLRTLAGDWELENIAVALAARRRGAGKRLIAAALALARESRARSVFLEVRESNAAARALYESAGFRPAGRRPGYYAAPREDAIVYKLLTRASADR
ncbi:MAG TPA: ribosomal protein S18-alanine N-acetyltransferase [Terriglobales bacterium]|nr:ribosomal protein S18-alanine N-acetyltransferase [Terriglobales bacterium]